MPSALEIRRRGYQAFLSHAHADSDAVARLYDWLRVARVRVFYDAVDFPPGSQIASALADEIAKSRALLLVLSRTSIESGWVKEEYNAAFNHRTQHPAFGIVPVRIDEVEPPGFLANYSYVDAPGGVLNLATATELLLALDRAGSGRPAGSVRDVYVSRSWREGEAAAARRVCRALAAELVGLIYALVRPHRRWVMDPGN
jgi:hypothetical protein